MKRVERGLAVALILLGSLHGGAGLLASDAIGSPELRLWFTTVAIVPIMTGLLVIERTRLTAPDVFYRTIVTIGLVSFLAACVVVAVLWDAWLLPQILAFFAVQIPLVWMTWRKPPAARA